jgi:hypothetical protein
LYVYQRVLVITEDYGDGLILVTPYDRGMNTDASGARCDVNYDGYRKGYCKESVWVLRIVE